MAKLHLTEIVEHYIQRNDTVKNWVEEQNWSPIEEQAGWKMFFFCCTIEPRLRGKVISYDKQVNQ